MNDEKTAKFIWETPFLLDLSKIEMTFGKGPTNSVEIHCTSPTGAESRHTYNPTTSGLPQAGTCRGDKD